MTTAIGGIAAALWLAGRIDDAVSLFAACDRLVAEDPAHEAADDLHLPMRHRYQAEAEAALSDTAAARATHRLAALPAGAVAAAARDLAETLLS